jgi:hypothetical protein
VLPDGAKARISGGRLDLPPITLRREWFTTLNNTCKLQLIDVEGDQQQQQQQQQDDDTEPPQQQHRPQRTLDQFYVRLAPYAEQLFLLPAGRLFENVVVKAHFAADWDTSLETRRLLVSTALQQNSRQPAAPAALSEHAAASHVWWCWWSFRH